MKEFFSRRKLLIIVVIGIVILALIIAVFVALRKHRSTETTSFDEASVAGVEEVTASQDVPALQETEEPDVQEEKTEQVTVVEPDKQTVPEKKADAEKPVVSEDATAPSEPEETYTAEEYYRDNSEEVIAVVDVKESEEVQTEKDVVTDLKERGFEDFSITYDSSMEGEYSDTTAADEDSGDKHPMYQTFYVTDHGDVWSIFAINGAVFANPVFFNLESELEGQVLFSESEELTSYDDETNQFYVTIPEETAVIVKVVDRIDADTLNKLTYEEIQNHE